MLYRDTAIQYNQNLITDLIFRTPGQNLIPVSMRNRNSNTMESVSGNNATGTKANENNYEEDDNHALASMIEDINQNINNEQEKKG